MASSCNSYPLTQPFTITLNPHGGGVFVSHSNAAEVSLTRTYDSVLPTTTLTLPSLPGLNGEYTSVAPVTLTVDFSEDVTDFTASDVTVTNGIANNVVEIAADQYTVDLVRFEVSRGCVGPLANGQLLGHFP
jgi:hypothetical protein